MSTKADKKFFGGHHPLYRVAQKMFFTTDLRMLEHRCTWDPTHIEKPERLSRILAQLEKAGLLDNVERVPSTKASVEDIKLVHPEEYLQKLAETSKMTEEQLEAFAGQYEDIYLVPETYELAFLSAGSALAVTKAVWDKGRGATGFSAIRPPGHHASASEPCGFCIFNNVAICAKKALEWGAKRVLIVDWDVHAGQGTQYAIRDAGDSIRLVSLHRWERGKFWPMLEESAVNNEYSNTTNIPLNATGLGDSEYLAAFHLVVLPLIHEYKPDLILVSCGFDAALGFFSSQCKYVSGDPDGQMRITPAGYGELTRLLVETGIPLSILLEVGKLKHVEARMKGGYYLDSIELDAEYTVRALQRLPLPIAETTKIHPEFAKSLAIVWERLAGQGLSTFGQFSVLRQVLSEATTVTEHSFEGERFNPRPYPTRGLYTYPQRTPEIVAGFRKELDELLKCYQIQKARGKLSVELVDEKKLSWTKEGNDLHFKLPSSFYKLAYYSIFLALEDRFELNIPEKNFDSADTKAFAFELKQLKSSEPFINLPVFSVADVQ